MRFCPRFNPILEAQSGYSGRCFRTIVWRALTLSTRRARSLRNWICIISGGWAMASGPGYCLVAGVEQPVSEVLGFRTGVLAWGLALDFARSVTRGTGRRMRVASSTPSLVGDSPDVTDACVGESERHACWKISMLVKNSFAMIGMM